MICPRGILLRIRRFWNYGGRNQPRWLQGPEFLRKPESEWPALPQLAPVDHDDPEVKCGPVCLLTREEGDMDPIDRLLSRYSDWTQMKKAVARILGS